MWSWARRLHGPRAGLLALGFYVIAPEALAHAGLVTMDVATALGFTASTHAFWRFARTGRRSAWSWCALAVGATALIRFTAVLLAPILMAVALLMIRRGWGRWRGVDLRNPPGGFARWGRSASRCCWPRGSRRPARGPWYLSFFNLAAGGPGGGYRLLNDSNVDWGQGLIALREEMRRRGISRIHLASHGTTDPAVYGIDYVPYLGGRPPGEGEWMAVSSYYYVGLKQRMMTREGFTPELTFDFSKLRQPPAATPAGCIFLFRLPEPAGGARGEH